MNLKKIIKESLEDDWEWAQFEPVEPRKRGDIRVGDIYTIYGSEYSVRYVLDVLEVTDDEVIYKILVTSDEEGEPVGSIQSTELDHAKRLVTQDNHWVLTDSYDKGFELKESNDFDWMKGDPYITIDEAIKNGIIDKGDKIWVRGYTKINSWDSDENAVYIDGWFIIDSLGGSLTSTNYKRASKEVCDVLECDSEGQFLDEDKDLVIYKIEKSDTKLTESDDFDWVREVPLNIPIDTLNIGKLYRIETTEVLREALDACSKSERLLHAYMGIPAMKSKDPYNQIFCDHEREDMVDSIYLEFYDDNHKYLGNFWITEDMVKFYLLKSDIKENKEDDWGWIDKSEYNPWDNYGYIEIDVEPKQENLELLVNLALSTNYVSSKSKQEWAIYMEGNILDIMDYFKDEGRAYIRLEDYDLWYGYSLKPYGKWTKYSEIFGKNINESEEDGFDWIRDTNFDTDMFINKAFYFDPIAEEGDKDYTKLVNHLINLGFKSEYATPTVLGRRTQAVGLYVYRDYNGGLKYVYTTFLDDDEDYELHIKDYARDNSEDRGENLEVVDARNFIKLIYL